MNIEAMWVSNAEATIVALEWASTYRTLTAAEHVELRTAYRVLL